VDKQADLHESVVVGPYAVIGPDVRIGPGTKVGPHTVISGPATIGAGNEIGPFATIGAAPQDLKYSGEPTELIVGDHNHIREYVTMHRGTVGGRQATVVGSDNYIMAYAHVAHDCRIGSRVIMSNAATLGGHVDVEDKAIIGGLVAVHQFCRIGAHAFIGGMSGINKDVPPFVIATGVRGEMRVSNINIVGLRRAGFSDEALAHLRAAFKIIFRRPELLLEEALQQALAEAPNCAEVIHLVDFFRTTRRSVLRSSANGE